MKSNVDKLNITIVGKTIILAIEDVSDEAQMFENIEQLQNYATQLKLTPHIEYDGEPYSIKEFIKFYNATFLTPQDRSIRELRELYDQLNQRVSALEEGEGATSEEETEEVVEKPKRQNRLSEHPVVQWHNRFRAGDPKIHRIAAILELVGITVRPMTPSGLASAFGPIKKNEVKSVKTVENIYDRRGEEGLRKIANAMMALDIKLYKEIWQATEYCLFISPKKMTPESFHGPAKKLLTENQWDDLISVVRLISQENKISNAIALGKLITGELSL